MLVCFASLFVQVGLFLLRVDIALGLGSCILVVLGHWRRLRRSDVLVAFSLFPFSLVAALGSAGSGPFLKACWHARLAF